MQNKTLKILALVALIVLAPITVRAECLPACVYFVSSSTPVCQSGEWSCLATGDCPPGWKGTTIDCSHHAMY
jgi:hypothetical protein